ncbi:hypothetical protein M5D96_006595, partial [Drosophila gunungcola]
MPENSNPSTIKRCQVRRLHIASGNNRNLIFMTFSQSMYLAKFHQELQLSAELKNILRTIRHEYFFIHFRFMFFLLP